MNKMFKHPDYQTIRLESLYHMGFEFTDGQSFQNWLSD
jgi:hypothetical protein